jgi:hypothetical protein
MVLSHQLFRETVPLKYLYGLKIFPYEIFVLAFSFRRRNSVGIVNLKFT